jgi:colanic acid biosynthesis protein WcaH
MGNTDWIPEELYKQIVEVMPIPCIDILVKHNNEYLLVKRVNEPLKDKWYVSGSRLLKNETVQDAVKRIAKTELGINARYSKVLCIYNAIYEVGYFGLPSHTFTLVVEATTKSEIIKLDKEHSDYMWVDKPFPNLHPYIKKAIQSAKGEI